MLIFLLKILLAHLVGDFLLQPKSWVVDKEKNTYKSKYLYLHVLLHAMLLLVLLSFNKCYWLAFILIPLSHLVIDAWKLHFSTKDNKRKLFFVDQLFHFLILILTSVAYYPDAELLSILFSNESILLAVCIVFATFVANIVMVTILSKWDLSKENSDENTLVQAGKYIGFLERLFIFFMLIFHYPLGVGFLITAKSVFRYNDLSKAKDRRLTEYVLIGSLLSFGLAIFAGLSFNFLKTLL